MNRLATLLSLSVLVLSALSGCSIKENLVELEGIDRKFGEERFDEVIVECREYLNRYSESARCWTLLGWAYSRSDSLDEAVRCFEKAIAINPKFDNAYVGRGAVLRELEDYAGARSSYDTAISINPDNAEAFSSLLVIEIIEGNEQQAVDYGEKAWRLRKDDPTIAANLALAYHYVGNEKMRDEFIQNARELGYRNMKGLQDIVSGELEIPRQR